MGITRPKPEEIVVKLRQVEVLTGQGIARLGTVRLMIANIRLMGQSKSMRSIIDATQPEQRHGLA